MGPMIELAGLTKVFGRTRAVDDLTCSIALLLVWPLLVEPVLGSLPSIGSEVGPYLPFLNASLFTRVPWLYPTYAMPRGEVGSLVYFAGVVAVVFVAAMVDVNRRDP
jgi:ABC-2 type transport system permease protein